MELNRNEKYKRLLQQLILDAKEDGGWSYPWLSRKLKEKGFDVTSKNLGTKVRSGVISGQLLLAIMDIGKIEFNSETVDKFEDKS